MFAMLLSVSMLLDVGNRASADRPSEKLLKDIKKSF